MKKLMSLITAIAIGSSSAAVAAPATLSASVNGAFSVSAGGQVRDHRRNGPTLRPAITTVRPTPVAVYERGPRPSVPTYDRFDWTSIAAIPTAAASYIQLPRDTSARWLLIEPTRGSLALSKVFVRYQGGYQYELDMSSMKIGPQGVVLPLAVMSTPVHQIIFYTAAGTSYGTFNASFAL